MHLSFANPVFATLDVKSEAFTPGQYKLQAFDETYPALSALYFDISNASESSESAPQAMCAMTQCHHFAPLLGNVDSTAPVLVMFLPQAFEGFLPQLAAAEVDVHNWSAMDLSENLTYCSWSIKDAEACANWGVWLPAYLLEVLEREGDRQPPAELEEWVEFHPIIWVAGETVVVGQVCIDDVLRVQINATVMAARSHDPKALSTAQEIEAAQQHAANSTPWKGQLYTLAANDIWPRQHVVEPVAYDCRSWQG